MMKKNVGNIERVIRAIVGLVAIAAFALGLVEGTMGIVAIIVGVIMLFTASIGWCPPYSVFGINTCNVKSSD